MTSPALNTMITTAPQLPVSVTGPMATLGGYFLFLLNTFALIHLLFLAGSIAYEKMNDRPSMVADIGLGEWGSKIVIGLWVATAAGDIAWVALR